MLTRRQRSRGAAGLAIVLAAFLGLALPGVVARPAPTPGRVTLDELAITTQDNAVLQWNAVALQAIRDTTPAPPVAARALAITHTAMFDAWAAYEPRALGTRLGSALRRPPAERTAANKREAISYAAYRALADLFPARLAEARAQLRALGYDPADDTTDVTIPAGIGNAAATALLSYRHRDGSNQLGDLAPGAYADYTGYQPVNTPAVLNDPSRWQPQRLPDGIGQRFSVPHWGRVTPFALRSAAQFRTPPPPFASAEHLAEVRQLLYLSADLNDYSKAIAEYWSDGPRSELPPGHWNLFAQWISKRDGNSLDEDVKLFFALTNAQLDASIAVWDSKRFYDNERPITGVRHLERGRIVRAWAGPYRGTRDIPSETWLPYFRQDVVTPPFPEHVSGHSAYSAASATVLAAFTGRDQFGAEAVVRRGSSLIEPGVTPSTDVTLRWPTFSAAADQAGISRRYGGIHYQAGDLAGRAMGRKVGELVVGTARSYIGATSLD